MVTDLDIDLQKDILKSFASLLTAEERYLILMGGAGSGKSWFCTQKVIFRATTNDNFRIGVFRKVARTLRQSVFHRIKSQINAWGLSPFFRINQTDMSFHFINGSEIILLGLDDPEKLKSIDELSSAWAEECTEFTEADFNQIDLRIRGESPGYKQILASFNPINVNHWLRERFFCSGIATNVRTHKSTYRDNPHCGEEYDVMLAELQRKNPNLGRIYKDAEWGLLEGLVYELPIMEMEYTPVNREIYGLDFGFNNPTALIRLGLKDVSPSKQTGDIYLREIIYQSGLTTPQLAEAMKAAGVSKTATIWADSAEPDRIAELKLHGYRVRPASKGKGSVNAGIDLCRCFTMHTCGDNVNLNAEFQTYSWETNKEGKLLDKQPVKFDDHAMDAMRYAVWSELGRKADAGGTEIKGLHDVALNA